MNLIDELLQRGAQWSISAKTRTQKEGVLALSRYLEVSIQLSAASQDVVLSEFNIHTTLSVEQMLAATLKKHAPQHPALLLWFKSKGNVPVKLQLTKKQLDEELGYAMHVGLRKLADSHCSVITWNALHHLHSDDRVALWDALRKTLEKQIKLQREAHKPVTRRILAEVIKNEAIKVLENLPGEWYKNGATRSRSEKFARSMMLGGCQITEMDEWMYGWLGYVLEDVEEDDAED